MDEEGYHCLRAGIYWAGTTTQTTQTYVRPTHSNHRWSSIRRSSRIRQTCYHWLVLASLPSFYLRFFSPHSVVCKWLFCSTGPSLSFIIIRLCTTSVSWNARVQAIERHDHLIGRLFISILCCRTCASLHWIVCWCSQDCMNLQLLEKICKALHTSGEDKGRWRGVGVASVN